MQASDIMTPVPRYRHAHDSRQGAASVMRDGDIGDVSIVDEPERLMDVITDRDDEHGKLCGIVVQVDQEHCNARPQREKTPHRMSTPY